MLHLLFVAAAIFLVLLRGWQMMILGLDCFAFVERINTCLGGERNYTFELFILAFWGFQD